MADKKDKKLSDGSSIPFRGGVDTLREHALLPIGKFSTLQNMRQRHPGLEQRTGMARKHSTAYSTTKFIRYYDQTGSFAAAASLVGYTSAATATVASVYDNGDSTGILALSSITGTFVDNEILYVASYGSELVTNGNCSADSFTKAAEWTHDAVDNEYDCSGVQTGNSNLSQTLAAPVIGEFFNGGFEVKNRSAGALSGNYGGTSFLAGSNSDDTYSAIFQAATTGTTLYIAGDSSFAGSADNITVKKVTNAALADGAAINSPKSLYQFSKGKQNEKHFFAQFGDNTLIEATDDPPTVTTGAFGTSVHSGTVGPNAASYSDLEDILIYSNGIDQHQLYAGTANNVLAFIRHDDAAAIDAQPKTYIDYTRQVTDGDSTTVAVLDSLDVIAQNEAIYIATPIPANRLTFTMSTANDTASVGTLKYWKSDSSWADTTETDGTISSGKTLGATGSMTWTSPSDEIPKFLFGINAYWYQWEVATQLNASVEVSAVTYGSGFGSLTNVWNGRKDYIIEAVYDDDSASTLSNFSGDNITLDAMTTSDALWISSHEPLQGIYIDVGGAPNTEATTTFIDMVWYWNGGAWALVTETDFTSGLENSGWIMWNRLTFGTEQRTRVEGSGVYAYWYKIMVATATTSVMNISIEGMPYYDITDFGTGGTSCVWKDRVSYSFNKYPNYLYISEMYRPNVLNGDDYAIMEAGDGRANEIVCQKKFHNELMVWQKEQGKDGGCLTIFEGYSPETFGKLVLSTKVGTFSPKSAVVIDGVLTSGETEAKFNTEAYFISHYGICMTDGLTVQIVSDDIQNYFDPSFTECIRRGYESEMWVEHDTAYNVLRFGLVSGTSATTCNIFPVYDLVDKTWSFDTLASNLSCMTEVEAASGDTPILQYGGGVSDGYVYRLNTGTNDIVGATPTTTAISSSVTLEISISNFILHLRELILRMKTQSAGDCTVTFYRRGVASSDTQTLSMTADITSDTSRRHRVGVKTLKGDQLSINFANAVASQSLYLLDFGLDISKSGDR